MSRMSRFESATLFEPSFADPMRVSGGVSRRRVLHQFTRSPVVRLLRDAAQSKGRQGEAG
jgi:hypothetical protein